MGVKPKPRRFCVDCPDTGRQPRPAPHPGPRCATHHHDKVKASKNTQHERYVQRVYGLGPGDYDRLYRFQGGRCAICRRATGATRALSVDHDHKDGQVRGLLCRPCNNLLGHLRDDPAAGYRLTKYLVDPPAQQVGIEAYHEEKRE